MQPVRSGRIAALSLLAASALLLNPILEGAEWASGRGFWYRYPLPGAEVKSLVPDPAIAGGFYVGTAQGGIYRSTDGGRSWTGAVGGAPFPGFSVTALTLDPYQKATLWSGLSRAVRGGILPKSEHSGQT